MSMVVNHNISAINTLRNLNHSNRMLSKSLEKLSSGYRINVGADGPADLVISEKLRAQGVGLAQAVRNTQEAMNVIGIAEGALNEMNEILKTMRQLALHAANSGVTSPSQVAADQAEVDSSIQTIDRIANTTKYSDQFLLNGAQDFTYTRSTLIDKATDNALLDVSATRFDQVFKTKDYAINVSFSGAATTAETYTTGTKQARRAMFEAYGSVTGTDIDAATKTTIDTQQRFILTGSLGSRSFSFSEGTHIGDIVSTINNVAGSTGVSAQLIFDDTVVGVAQSGDTVEIGAFATARATGNISTFHMDSLYQQDGAHASEWVSVALGAGTDIDAVVVGGNTDGDGRIWLKWTSATTYDIYKDRALTMQIGSGTESVAGQSWIRSGDLGSTNTMTITAEAGVSTNDITMIQLANAHEIDTGTAANAIDDTLMSGLYLSDLTNGSNLLSGVRLGYNTDVNGKLYFKVVSAAAGAATSTVSIYKDSQMRDVDLVAQATNVDLSNTDAADDDVTVNVWAVSMGGGSGATSGLYGTLVFNDASDAIEGQTLTGELAFQSLGIRLYSNDYGDNSFLTVDAKDGALFTHYTDPNDNTTGTLLDAGTTGAKMTTYGQNASIILDGREVELEGMSGNVATPNIAGKLTFNEGELGMTTLAQVGYDQGAIYARALEVNNVGTSTTDGNLATNAIHNTTERLHDFSGGMQYQLGEGDGDQERTIYAIQSMAAIKLGQTKFYDDFEGQGLKEWQTLGLEDILAGGYVALAKDPTKALSIVDQAIDDVSDLRARLGAFQKNMLQTNVNSLNIAVENITATESSIRDANIAAETTEFTKNQILIQAGTAMLAQANLVSQNVLQLLG
ncbi:MAG: flagellin [Planctomycetota bacterium]